MKYWTYRISVRPAGDILLVTVTEDNDIHTGYFYDFNTKEVFIHTLPIDDMRQQIISFMKQVCINDKYATFIGMKVTLITHEKRNTYSLDFDQINYLINKFHR